MEKQKSKIDFKNLQFQEDFCRESQSAVGSSVINVDDRVNVILCASFRDGGKCNFGGNCPKADKFTMITTTEYRNKTK